MPSNRSTLVVENLTKNPFSAASVLFSENSCNGSEQGTTF